jgi:hypothetical protein
MMKKGGKQMSELIRSMEDEFRKWRLSAKGYAFLYGSLRASLIILSAVVAAQNNLKGSPMDSLVSWVPIMALAVTILTAIDTWQKPLVKWRGFMQDRDALEDLIVRAKDTKEDPQALLKEFDALRDRHRKEHVF